MSEESTTPDLVELWRRALETTNVSAWTDGLSTRVATYTNVGEARAAAKRLAESRG
jgi:hypothetical protein